jgi:hypothetical protein
LRRSGETPVLAFAVALASGIGQGFSLGTRATTNPGFSPWGMPSIAASGDKMAVSKLMNKEHILNEVRRTAAANGGIPLGKKKFFSETGIKESDWLGKFWPRWSSVVEEAGFKPLELQGKHDRAASLEKVAKLIRKFGRFPTVPEMRLERKSNAEFPNTSTLLRIGARSGLIEELIEFCRSDQLHEDVLKILKATGSVPKSAKAVYETDAKAQFGYVYLICSAKRYKIGFSKAALNRASVVSNLSPEGGEIVHLIRTDDMRGIEAYWHNRFAGKRGNGEWFALSAADVAAFKRRKFM